MKTIFENFVEYFEKNSTRMYLILTNSIVVIFAIWFSNAGLLPFKSVSDFSVFALLVLILGLYRPSWTFAFFIGTLVLENVSLAPKGFPVALHPYQFFGVVTIVALLVQVFFKRMVFALPKFSRVEFLVIVFVLGGFLSALGAANKAASFKQALVAASFAVLFFLVRAYLQTFEEVKRMMPFFLSSSLVVVFYGIWQNVQFLRGANSFEVMPGRPNGTFPEADWYGIFITFLIAVLFSAIYYLQSGKNKIDTAQILNFKFQILNKIFNIKILKQVALYFFVTLAFVVLILTVSRSAWVGAVLVAIGFWKVLLTNGSVKISNWQWKKMTLHVAATIATLGIAMGISSSLTRFQIANRVSSTGGLQKITIACPQNTGSTIPDVISSLQDILPCRHINLEDIEREKTQGNSIREVLRPDPTIGVRGQIYRTSVSVIKSHPILGIGWGNISKILGTDERGAGLNASNMFLEIYLGAGILGIISFVILLVWIFAVMAVKYFDNTTKDKTPMVLISLTWLAIVVPNLFNSGIFLGFLWVSLAVAVGILNKKE